MALIKCPECGEQISEKATTCIHCGYPLQGNSVKPTVPEKYKVILVSTGIKVKSIKEVSELTNKSPSEALSLVNSMPCIIKENLEFDEAKDIQNSFASFNATVKIESMNEIEPTNYVSFVTCPRCGSNQITTGQRGFGLFTGFLGSNKTVNRCAKCGYVWKP